MRQIKLPSLIIIAVSLFLSLTFTQKLVFAQTPPPTLSISPTNVGCNDNVIFSYAQLDSTERYRILMTCDSTIPYNSCGSARLVIMGGSDGLGGIINSNGGGVSASFDISNGCIDGLSADYDLPAGTYDTSLQWNCSSDTYCANFIEGQSLFLHDDDCECTPSGGTQCNITNYCGEGFSEDCLGINNGYCTASGCNCVDSTPSITIAPTAIIGPTQPVATAFFTQCGDYCDDSNYPFGNCLTSRRDGCQRPTDEDGVGLDEDGSRDCSISNRSLDCWCCTQLYLPTPRVELNPLCPNDPNAISTAIGCLPIGDKNAFLTFILRWAIGISGGVSFILIIISGFMIMTASGDKRKLQSGRELLTAAIAGIILIIFSVFILDLVGIRILRIPGL